MTDTINNELVAKESDIPEKYKINTINQKTYLSGGQLKTWTGPTQEVLSPVCIYDGQNSIQKVLGSYPLMDAATAVSVMNDAVKAYNEGNGEWPRMPIDERIMHLEGFLTGMSNVKDEVAKILMWEIGKTYKDSVKEIDRTIEYGKKTIEAAKELYANSPIMEIEGIKAQMEKTPLGTVLAMGPFNYPLNETFATMLPALIMGNTIVLKPAKYGVLLHEPLLKLYQENFPEGTINTIYGDGKEIIGPIMATGQIDALAFIGTSKVANIIKGQHPQLYLPSVLGMDAKNPAIIFDDADLDTVVSECLQGTLSYNGQRCTALKILYVQKGIMPKFLEKFTEKVDAMKIGLPWVDGVSITGLPEYGKTKSMNDLVEDALLKGAKLANRGGKSFKTYFSPAILTGVNDKMRLYHEEQFGPVIPIVEFETMDEPLNYVINSSFGQQASVFSSDVETIKKCIKVLQNQVARVNINSQCQRGPDEFIFSGRKNSASGALSITDALHAFSAGSLVSGKVNAKNTPILDAVLRK